MTQSQEDIPTRARNELLKYGEIALIEITNKTEEKIDIHVGFTLDKDAVLALKTPIRIEFGNQDNIKSFLVEPSPGFKKYLTDLSSSLRLQSTSTASVPKIGATKAPEEQIEKNKENKGQVASNKDQKNSMEIEKPQKVVIKDSSRQKKAPLEIVKPNKSTRTQRSPENARKRTQTRSRSRSESVMREKGNSFKKRDRKLTEDLSRDFRRRERRKESDDRFGGGKERRNRGSFHEKMTRDYRGKFLNNI